MNAIERTCGYCCSRRPLAELGQVPGTGGYQCLDSAACQARAQAAMLYPVTDVDSFGHMHLIEQAIAAAEVSAGAAGRQER